VYYINIKGEIKLKELLLVTIISIFLPGCWVVVGPVPTRHETVVIEDQHQHVIVEEPAPVVFVEEYPVCEYIEDPYPYENVAYCTDDSCVWEFYYASVWCEEEWYHSYDCGWELGYNSCYYYNY